MGHIGDQFCLHPLCLHLLFRSHGHHIRQGVQILRNLLERTKEPLRGDLFTQIAGLHSLNALLEDTVAITAVDHQAGKYQAPYKQREYRIPMGSCGCTDEQQNDTQCAAGNDPFPDHGKHPEHIPDIAAHLTQPFGHITPGFVEKLPDKLQHSSAQAVPPPETTGYFELSGQRSKEANIRSRYDHTAATQQHQKQHIIAVIIKEHIQQFNHTRNTKDGNAYRSRQIQIQRQTVQRPGICFAGSGIFTRQTHQQDESHRKEDQAACRNGNQRILGIKEPFDCILRKAGIEVITGSLPADINIYLVAYFILPINRYLFAGLIIVEIFDIVQILCQDRIVGIHFENKPQGIPFKLGGMGIAEYVAILLNGIAPVPVIQVIPVFHIVNGIGMAGL